MFVFSLNLSTRNGNKANLINEIHTSRFTGVIILQRCFILTPSNRSWGNREEAEKPYLACRLLASGVLLN